MLKASRLSPFDILVVTVDKLCDLEKAHTGISARTFHRAREIAYLLYLRKLDYLPEIEIDVDTQEVTVVWRYADQYLKIVYSGLYKAAVHSTNREDEHWDDIYEKETILEIIYEVRLLMAEHKRV